MRLISTNRYYLPGTANRFLHLATIQYGLREFMCFNDIQTQKTYIEEITGGHLSFIEDDSLAEALTNFLTEQKVLDINKPTIPDKQWLYNGK